MIVDKYSQQIYNELDLCILYLQDPDRIIKRALVANEIKFSPILDLDTTAIPHLIKYTSSDLTVEEFDRAGQSVWHMPGEYREMDIVQYILDKCSTEEELQRVGHELIAYQSRDMFMLLRYLKYLVDTMRKHNIVWGVGRGSSVASFVLYLIGIHKINSLFYGLPFEEFIS